MSGFSRLPLPRVGRASFMDVLYMKKSRFWSQCYFFIMSICTLNHVKFLSLRQGRDKHMHNDVHIYGMQAHI